MKFKPYAKPVVSAEELLACLFAEYKYWMNFEAKDDQGDGIAIGATGAISNVIAFATIEKFRADWHPEKSDLVRKPSLPRPDTTWRVETWPMDNYVRVRPQEGSNPGTTTEGTDVYPPNLIERWFGRTYKNKIASARQRWQKVCDKRNAFRDKAEAAARSSKDGEASASKATAKTKKS